jgi:hypothetical protein
MLNTRKTLLIVVVLLLVGLVMVLMTKIMMSMEIRAGSMELGAGSMETGTVVVALLFPLLTYALLSGVIEEFGFGELKAKLRAAGATIILPELGKMLPTHGDFQQVGEKGSAVLEQMLATYKLDEAKPIVLNIKLGRGDYKRAQTLDFIRQLSIYRSFKLMVFLDQHDRVIAYMPGWAARQLMTDDEGGELFIAAINHNQVKKLLDLPKVVSKPLSMQATNAEALRQMAALNMEALVVVDVDGYLKGVLERDGVVAKMMLALVDKPAP